MRAIRVLSPALKQDDAAAWLGDPGACEWQPVGSSWSASHVSHTDCCSFVIPLSFHYDWLAAYPSAIEARPTRHTHTQLSQPCSRIQHITVASVQQRPLACSFSPDSFTINLCVSYVRITFVVI